MSVKLNSSRFFFLKQHLIQMLFGIVTSNRRYTESAYNTPKQDHPSYFFKMAFHLIGKLLELIVDGHFALSLSQLQI